MSRCYVPEYKKNTIVTLFKINNFVWQCNKTDNEIHKKNTTFNDFANFAQRYKCRVVLLPKHNSYLDMPLLCIKCFYYGLWPTQDQLINILLIYLCELKCIGRNK